VTDPRAVPQPPAFWELSESERRALSDADLVDEDEHFVLWKINHGRHMVKSAEDRAYPGPIELEGGLEIGDECPYYDAIASLPFAAVQDGFDPEQVCRDAIDQYKSFTETARAQGQELRGGQAESATSIHLDQV
jgi:hypothetical protein